MTNGNKKGFLDNLKLLLEIGKIGVGLWLVYITLGIKADLPYVDMINNLMDDFSSVDQRQDIALTALNETIGDDPKRKKMVVSIAKIIGKDKARQFQKNCKSKPSEANYFQIETISNIVKQRDTENEFENFNKEIAEIIKSCQLSPENTKNKTESEIKINARIAENTNSTITDKKGTVYIHYNPKIPVDKINTLKNQLEKNWIVQPTQAVKNFQSPNQIRYFHGDENLLAEELQKDIEQLSGLTITPKGFATDEYSQIVPLKQLEVWISNYK